MCRIASALSFSGADRALTKELDRFMVSAIDCAAVVIRSCALAVFVAMYIGCIGAYSLPPALLKPGAIGLSGYLGSGAVTAALMEYDALPTW